MFGFVYMVLMRYCSGCMTWLSILLYFVFLIAVGFMCYNKYKNE